ncbi:hypothetical protein RHGRI_005546 [Rhododendron griersonianum]|uniref:Secreted protein n=1 Tax=Rhododendron griersonianum TaxID=479676 RepID=A0AAV6LCQ0_9ERIC|nr:hypothetical protein RHGRI_005546 [Rhododendron griersonianum]
MKTSYGSVSASSLIDSVFVISIFLISIVSGNKSISLITCFGDCSSNSESRVAPVELRTKVNESRAQAVLLSDRSSSAAAATTTTSSSVNPRFRNLNVIVRTHSPIISLD